MSDITSPSALLPQDAHLGMLLRNALTAREGAAALLEKLTVEQLHWQPEEDVWSIAQCLNHLTRTGRLYLDKLQPLIKRNRESGSGSTAGFKPRYLQRLFIKTVGPGANLRLPAPSLFAAEMQPPDSSGGDFLEVMDEIIEAIRLADGLDLNSPRLSSPLTRLLRFSIGEALWLLVAHTQRHLLQASRVMKQEEFPSAN